MHLPGARAGVFFAMALAFGLGTSAARAGTATSITGLYRTGEQYHVEDWWKLVDNHWTATNAEGKAYVLWYSLGASSNSAAWISAGPTGYPAAGLDYSYSLAFNIAGTGTGAANNAAISLTLYVDDTATIYVNGVQTAVVSGNNLASTPTTLTLSSNFVLGANTIRIAVNNAGGATGLMVSSITGVVPEAGAWLPVAAGLGAVCWFRFGRRKKLPLAA